MIKTNLDRILTGAKTMILAMATVLTVLTGAAFADDITLDMEGTTASIPKGNTVERKIFGVPAGIPGNLKLKMKWHAVNLIPNTFNRLKVEVMHGSAVLDSDNCYSIHSDKTPKCSFNIGISQTEADKSGVWKLRVTNNSNDETIGFNITKENGDVNPFVPNFRSVYTPDCPNTVNLDMEGTTLTLPKGNSAERKIYGIGKAAGVIKLRIKWHAVALLPTFNALKIELFDSNGNKVNAGSGNFFSTHAPSSSSPQYELTINATAAQTSGPNNWKLKITNNSNQEVIGFNIAKESGDLNPTVPSFHSTYKANCGF
jgi:hypothetical protein